MRYASLRQGLVGAWCPSVSGPFGYRLPDLSGYGNHGTLTNMDPPNDWVVSGGKGALDFDGSNDYVVTQESSVFDISGKNAMTVSAWLKSPITSATDNVNIVAVTEIGNGGADQDKRLFIDYSTGKFAFQVFDGSSRVSLSNSVNDTAWHHLAGRFDGTNVRLYVDGILQSTVTTATQSQDFASPQLLIGGVTSDMTSVDRYFSGLIDDIRFYNRALSDQEIRFLASERGIGLKPERQRNRYMIPRNRSSRFIGFPS